MDGLRLVGLFDVVLVPLHHLGVDRAAGQMQRVAQVKAARVAGEYLKGSINKSVTVYENIENESYTFSDEANEDSKTQNATSSSTIEQNVSDKTEKTSEVNFSDKIIQSSLTRVNHMEPLTRFIGEDGSQLFAFYIILK